MIELAQLARYQENNRLEAKRAQGGLPHSLWETYSAFANTVGGALLLGVIETPDKYFQAVPLPDPQSWPTSSGRSSPIRSWSASICFCGNRFRLSPRRIIRSY